MDWDARATHCGYRNPFFRLLVHATAYVLAAHVKRSARRPWVRLPQSFPLASLFLMLACALQGDTS